MFPEYYVGGEFDFLPDMMDSYKLWFMFKDKILLKFYERVDGFWYMDNAVHVHSDNRHASLKEIFKLKAEFRDRMIKKGYSQGHPESMGVLQDLDKKYHGYKSVYDDL